MTVDMDLVESLLRRQFPSTERDADGDLAVTLVSPNGYEVMMWVMQSGRTGGVLELTSESGRHRVSRSRWAEAVWVCNQWNQRHFFPRVSLLIADWASAVVAPVQCRTVLELASGQYDAEFLDGQISGAAHYSLEFYGWLDAEPQLEALFCDFDEQREREHVRHMISTGRTPGDSSFAEEFLVDEASERVREPDGFWW